MYISSHSGLLLQCVSIPVLICNTIHQCYGSHLHVCANSWMFELYSSPPNVVWCMHSRLHKHVYASYSQSNVPKSKPWLNVFDRSDQLVDTCMKGTQTHTCNPLWHYNVPLPFWLCTQGQKTSQCVRTENGRLLRAWLVDELSAPVACQWRAPQTEPYHATVEEGEESTFDRKKRKDRKI